MKYMYMPNSNIQGSACVRSWDKISGDPIFSLDFPLSNCKLLRNQNPCLSKASDKIVSLCQIS